MSGVSEQVSGLHCSISGAIPEEPVVSIKSGHIFEKRLIEKSLSVNGGVCPETGEQLSPSDLIAVKRSGTVVEPVTAKGASVPSVLDFLRTEWDKTVLELHQVKTKLNETRKELAAALYKNDAAEKAIAKLTREIDELKSERPVRVPTERPKETPTEKVNGDAQEPLVFDNELLRRVEKKMTELQTKRKARVLPNSHASSSAVGAFGEAGVVKIENRGAVCCLLRSEKAVFAGMASGDIVNLDVSAMNLGKSAAAHDGGVCRLRWCDERLVSGGADGFVKFWRTGDGDAPNQLLSQTGGWNCGVGDIADVDTHPLGDLLFIAGADGRWVWKDMDGSSMARGRADGRVWSGAVHPDGIVFATGGKGCVQMWDAKSMKCVARLETGEEPVRDLGMSEKGYYMATSSGAKMKLWDLRKQAVSGEVDVGDALGVAFDSAGEFGYVIGDKEVALFSGKKKAKVLTRLVANQAADAETNSTRMRVGGLWGHDAHYVLVGTADGCVRKFAQMEA